MKIEKGKYILITLGLSGELYFSLLNVIAQMKFSGEDGKPRDYILCNGRGREVYIGSERANRSLIIPYEGNNPPFLPLKDGLAKYGWLNQDFKMRGGLFLFCNQENYDEVKALINTALENQGRSFISVFLITEKNIEENSFDGVVNVNEHCKQDDIPEGFIEFLRKSFLKKE